MWYWILAIISILFMNPLSNTFAQSNLYDGFTGFVSGQGARNVGLSESNGAESHMEFDSWSVNPAGISPSSWSNGVLHSSFYPGDIRSFALAGLVSRDTLWPVVVGLARTSFGQTARYDAEGNEMGTFGASATRLSVGSRRQLSDDFYLGLSMHYNWRAIDFYNSHVIHFSVGGIFDSGERNSYGITLTNLGYEIIPFESQRHELPLDLSLFWRRELNHLPFTFFLRMQKLNLWNRMEFDQPFSSGDQNLNQDAVKNLGIRNLTEEILRHMVIGGEFAFGSPARVWLRFSYDHWRNRQLGIPGIRSLEGVALGFGFRLDVVRLDYTWERLYYDSGSHQISLAFRLFEKDRRQRGF